MAAAEAQRTLVKSAPELWAELSDPAALSRHLDAFGEVRITRLDPESAVAWEGERARGTVELAPSGWGTRVKITAELTAPAPEPAPERVHEAPAETEEPPTAAAEPAAATPWYPAETAMPDGTIAVAAAEPVEQHAIEATPAPLEEHAIEGSPAAGSGAAEPPPPHAPDVEAVQAVPARPGLIGRFFRRRRAAVDTPAGPSATFFPVLPADAPTPAPPAAGAPDPAFELAAAEPEPLVPDPPTLAAPEPEPTPFESPAADVAAEPASLPSEPAPVAEPDPPAAEVAPEPEAVHTEPGPATEAEQPAQEILAGVLDALGSAHHRPFSRG